MSAVRIVVLVIALGAAVLAAFLVQQSINSGSEKSAEGSQSIATARVLVAAREIPAGKKLEALDLKWQDWPKSVLTAQFILAENGADQVNEIVGALARNSIAQGEPVFSGRVIKTSESGILAAMLRPGMRAVSLKVSSDTAVGGFILPNDRVDIIQTVDNTGGGVRGVTSRTILHNVRVLAIDQVYQGGGEEATVLGKVATVELTPEQAELLRRADREGELSLTLRAVRDPDAAGAQDTLAQVEQKPAYLGAAGKSDITVIRYGQTSYTSGSTSE